MTDSFLTGKVDSSVASFEQHSRYEQLKSLDFEVTFANAVVFIR